MNIKFSIIIPIFNMQNYLADCLDSLINQDYSNCEFLLIDDGSSDFSKKICIEYQKKDSRFTYYYKKNGGLSTARNLGIEVSKGKFILFLDSDDYVHKDFLHDLNEITCKDESSVVFSYITFTNENKEIFDISKATKEKNILLSYVLKKLGFVVWNKLYITDIIKRNKILFKNTEPSEDQEFNINYFSHVKKVNFIEKPLYFYRIRKGSITHTHSYVHLSKLLPSTDSIYSNLFNSLNIKDYLVLHYLFVYKSYIGSVFAIKLKSLEIKKIFHIISIDYKVKKYNLHKFLIKIPISYNILRFFLNLNPYFLYILFRIYYLIKFNLK